jgi:hypothetical protein
LGALILPSNNCAVATFKFNGAPGAFAVILPEFPDRGLVNWSLVNVESDTLMNGTLGLEAIPYLNIANGGSLNPTLLCVIRKGTTNPAFAPATLPAGTTVFCYSDAALALVTAYFTTF